ncbi:S10 family peptidase [Rhodopila sp.]|uniref:S10 family peptidase n=1 Tax=Rhodopila sp. TaxID=2480087 RepID=UPI003D1325A6
MMMPLLLLLSLLAWCVPHPAHAQRSDPPTREPEAVHLPADLTTHQALDLPGRVLRFTATAGSIRLRDGKDAPVADIAFIAYQMESAEAILRPVTFVFNGGPGMASAWLQMGALGPWRVRLDTHVDGPSASPVPVPNAETWLDFTDLVFIDPPGTGYSSVVATDADTRRRLWSVGGDIDALAVTIRRWLDRNGRMASPKYIVGESYGGFRGPRLVRKLQSDEGIGVSGLVLLSPLLDVHQESGFADPLSWVDLLPSEVAVVRAEHGPVERSDLADVEAYAHGAYITDILRGEHDAAATDRLTTQVAALTGLDTALVRRMHGRLDASVFQQAVAPGQVASVYDGTATRPDPTPRQLDGQFPDPVLGGFEAPVTSAMMAIYTGKLNWRPDMVYHLSSDAVFGSWDWGHGLGRPESLTALQAARSVDPHLRVLVAQGLFDLRTPYAGTARLLDMLPEMTGAAPVVLKVYPGGHMFYFTDASRAALREDAKAVFDPPE